MQLLWFMNNFCSASNLDTYFQIWGHKWVNPIVVHIFHVCRKTCHTTCYPINESIDKFFGSIKIQFKYPIIILTNTYVSIKLLLPLPFSYQNIIHGPNSIMVSRLTTCCKNCNLGQYLYDWSSKRNKLDKLSVFWFPKINKSIKVHRQKSDHFTSGQPTDFTSWCMFNIYVLRITVSNIYLKSLWLGTVGSKTTLWHKK